MKRTQPLVPRGFGCSVVTVKKLVMQLVMKIAHLDVQHAGLNYIEPHMGRRSAYPVVKHQEQHMQRIGR